MGWASIRCEGRASAFRKIIPIAFLCLGASVGLAQAPYDAVAMADGPNQFKGLTLDELMDLEITLVTKSPQRLASSPSAVQVITGEQIRRSGALSLPEALRLAPNLHVAQLNAHDWAISARGFNGTPRSNSALSDKLLVMIDGRAVYTPLFGGVLWDVQNVLLEDVDRIEVISGPGGTLWGANAVNGVINVSSKSARDTQGLYLSGGGGTFWQDFGAVRYGGKIGDDLYYRIYAQGFEHSNTFLPGDGSAGDDWSMHQTGFRTDYLPGPDDTFTVQGDIYEGQEEGVQEVDINGGNLLGRWTHVISKESEFIVQAYFDATHRTATDVGFGDALRTYDIDFQHRFPLGDRQSITWGLGYRLAHDRVNNSPPALNFSPSRRVLDLFSGFIQDEISIVPQKLLLTLGSKLEHNEYSGFEFQPSARLAWIVNSRNTFWAAVSRAVRSPSRFDVDFDTPVIVTPGKNFESEKVTAYEIGYRTRPLEQLSLSIAGFYNTYDDLRSVDANPNAPPVFIFANHQAAESWGAELLAELQMADGWRLRGGYTYLEKNIWSTDTGVVPGSDVVLGNDPNHQVVVQSMMDLPRNLEFDLVGRFVGSLPSPAVDSYFSLDARLAWRKDNMEIAIVGQNLLDNRHAEFSTLEIPRSVYGSLTLRW